MDAEKIAPVAFSILDSARGRGKHGSVRGKHTQTRKEHCDQEISKVVVTIKSNILSPTSVGLNVK
jgi:hypothetical protein